MTEIPDIGGLLILPRLRIQNANAISSPMTHGFPSITAFLGLMWALGRKLPDHQSPLFDGIGVICHRAEEQVTKGGYVRTFRLTRNPVEKDGGTAAIVEEGRIHLEVSLLLAIRSGDPVLESTDVQRQAVADAVADEVSRSRIAGAASYRQRPSPGKPGPSSSGWIRSQPRELGRFDICGGSGCLASHWCHGMICYSKGSKRCVSITPKQVLWTPGWICRDSIGAPFNPTRTMKCPALPEGLLNGGPIPAKDGSSPFLWGTAGWVRFSPPALSPMRVMPKRRCVLWRACIRLVNG